VWIGSPASTLRSVSTICVPPAAPSVFSSISRSQKSSGSASSMGFRFPNRLSCQPWRGKYHVVCPSISWTLHYRYCPIPLHVCPAGRFSEWSDHRSDSRIRLIRDGAAAPNPLRTLREACAHWASSAVMGTAPQYGYGGVLDD